MNKIVLATVTHSFYVVVIMCLFLITGCSGTQDRIEKQIPITQQALSTLNKAISDNKIRNATILNQYATVLQQQRPELKDLVQQLVNDATIKGPMYEELTNRLNAAKQSSNFSTLEEQLIELLTVAQAADPQVYNDALSDVVNVLADLSDGKLARVNAISRQSEISANAAKDFGDGSQLIGNPHYGRWSTGSSGGSFWEWYGMYAMFSHLSGSRYYYHDWAPRRGYSYYHDYGRSNYTSPSRYKKQDAVLANTKKRFSQSNKRFASPYAKNKTGSSGLSTKSTNRSTSGSNRFQSSYRNSSSRTNRGTSFGK